MLSVGSNILNISCPPLIKILSHK